MRVLWIAYLLIGCITCFPMGRDHGANSAAPSFMRPPLSLESWFSGRVVSSDPGSSSPLPSLPNPSSNKAAGRLPPQDGFFWAGPGRVGSSNMAAGNAFGSASFREGHYSPEVRAREAAYAGHGAPHGLLGSAYDGWSPEPADGWSPEPADGWSPEPADGWSPEPADGWSPEPADFYGAVEKLPEPVFSDVSALEPLYALSSRSNYQRGRAVFAQTRFAPGKLVRPRMPVLRLISRISEHSGPVRAPTNGAF